MSGRADGGSPARIDHAKDALAGKNEAGAAGKADEIRERGNHKLRQPECKATMPPVMS